MSNIFENLQAVLTHLSLVDRSLSPDLPQQALLDLKASLTVYFEDLEAEFGKASLKEAKRALWSRPEWKQHQRWAEKSTAHREAAAQRKRLSLERMKTRESTRYLQAIQRQAKWLNSPQTKALLNKMQFERLEWYLEQRALQSRAKFAAKATGSKPVPTDLTREMAATGKALASLDEGFAPFTTTHDWVGALSWDAVDVLAKKCRNLNYDWVDVVRGFLKEIVLKGLEQADLTKGDRYQLEKLAEEP